MAEYELYMLGVVGSNPIPTTKYEYEYEYKYKIRFYADV